MVIQSRASPVPLLLTRPAAQAVVFGRDLSRRFGDQLRIVKTPLMAPRFYQPGLPDGPFEALILTSQTALDALARMGGAAMGLPCDVFCVGEQTALAARRNGMNATVVAQDAAALIAQIRARRPLGKLLHLRGKEARGNIEEHLNSAGIETSDAVVYAQEKQPLTQEAQEVLKSTAPVLVPLFSPRTAALFAAEVARTKGVAPLFLAAISRDAAVELTGLDARVRIAVKPDAASMATTVGLLLADVQRA